MFASAAVVRFDRPSSPTFGNGLGLLLHEQRCLRRAHPRRHPSRGLSPFASLRRRVLAAAALR